AGAERAGWVGRARPQRGGASGGDDRGAGGDRLAGDHAAACEQTGHAAAFQDLDLRFLGRGGGERSEDSPAGRAPACVDDPAAAVSALEPEGEVTVAVGVELAAELLQLPHPV